MLHLSIMYLAMLDLDLVPNMLQKDVLFVGLTRTPMIMGVPYAAFVAEIMFMAIEHVMVGNPLYLFGIVPIHAIFYMIGAHDPGIFMEIAAWSKTTSRCRNKRFWEMPSFSPLAFKKWQREE